MNITIKEAENLAKKYLLKSNLENGKFLFAHSKGVVSTIQSISKKKKLDSKMLEKCAWLHDIGYFSGKENHAESSLKLIEKEKIILNEIEKDCILNHGTNGMPKTTEGKAMKAADKISLLNPEVIDILIKQEKVTDFDIDFIKKCCEQAFIDLKGL